MSKILVSGLITMETTVKVAPFPIPYEPIFYPSFGVNSTVSGVAINVSKALKTLGNEVNCVSIIGNDLIGNHVLHYLEQENISTDYIQQQMNQTSETVVLYEESGRRQVYCDLKNVQDLTINEEVFLSAMNDSELVALCNINFSRPFLKKARELNKIVATDVHVINSVHDEYNSDFMKYANILFLSNEHIQNKEEEMIQELVNTYDNDVIVVGMGKLGALLYTKESKSIQHFKAVETRKVVNTIGAGDSLFSAFIHYYNETKDAEQSLRKAIVFASYKIGEKGAAEGFLNKDELEKLCIEVYK